MSACVRMCVCVCVYTYFNVCFYMCVYVLLKEHFGVNNFFTDSRRALAELFQRWYLDDNYRPGMNPDESPVYHDMTSTTVIHETEVRYKVI